MGGGRAPPMEICLARPCSMVPALPHCYHRHRGADCFGVGDIPGGSGGFAGPAACRAHCENVTGCQPWPPRECAPSRRPPAPLRIWHRKPTSISTSAPPTAPAPIRHWTMESSAPRMDRRGARWPASAASLASSCSERPAPPALWWSTAAQWTGTRRGRPAVYRRCPGRPVSLHSALLVPGTVQPSLGS